MSKSGENSSFCPRWNTTLVVLVVLSGLNEIPFVHPVHKPGLLSAPCKREASEGGPSPYTPIWRWGQCKWGASSWRGPCGCGPQTMKSWDLKFESGYCHIFFCFNFPHLWKKMGGWKQKVKNTAFLHFFATSHSSPLFSYELTCPKLVRRWWVPKRIAWITIF